MLSTKMLIEMQEYVEKSIHIQIFDVYNEESLFSDEMYHNELEDFINTNRKSTFAEVLFGFIDKKGDSDSDIYKKAGIDRRHFSKIRSNPNYKLGKNTAIALALALELNEEETDELLSSAGFSLSDSDIFDLVIQFCLMKKIYNLDEVNQSLDYLGLKPIH